MGGGGGRGGGGLEQLFHSPQILSAAKRATEGNPITIEKEESCMYRNRRTVHLSKLLRTSKKCICGAALLGLSKSIYKL